MNNKIDLIESLLGDYHKAMKTGDAKLAADAVESALAEGLSPTKVYLNILVPAQTEVGEQWSRGEINLSQVHLGTQITANQMARLRTLIRPKLELGLRAVVATIDGDQHSLGCQVVADFLHMDGWTVDYLGTNIPPDDLIKFIRSREPDLVGISVTLSQYLPEVRTLLEQIKQLPKIPKILVGGKAAIEASANGKLANADAVPNNAEEALSASRKLCSLTTREAALQYFLRALGQRIQENRKLRKFSQQELADSSGLDRAYISSVENGRQNVTLGAVFKLSDALDISFEDLLAGSTRNSGRLLKL